MNAAQLLAHFECVAEAPDAVPRLRRFIHDLAARGQLVPQYPGEAAQDLISLDFSKRTRRKGSEGFNEDTWPFEVPSSWSWHKLEALSIQITDGEHATPSRITERQVPLVTAKNVRDGAMDYTNTDWVSHETAAKAWQRCRPQVADILLVCVGATTGRLCVLKERRAMVLVRSVALIRPSDAIAVDFLAVVLRSPTSQTQIWNKVKVNAQPCLYINRINSLAIPLPPLAEQHRIVAKVDELMALCDELEAAQAKREQRRDRLVAATLHGLNNGNASEASARFTFQHLPPLTTRPEHIRQLRQTILNLAVRGKLVPQDTREGTAAELFERVEREKQRLIKAGESRRQRLQPCVSVEEIPYLLPSSWQWMRLGSLAREITSGSRGWAEYYSAVGPKFIRAQNIRFGRLELNDIAHVELPAATEGKRTSVRKGDLLVVITGAGVTNPAMLDVYIGEAYVSQHVGLVCPMELRTSRWLLTCLMATAACRGELLERAYGAGKPGLNLDNIRMLRVPFPPLAEQHRIVAKVDELMALCDALEAQLNSTADTSRQLLEATLHETLG